MRGDGKETPRTAMPGPVGTFPGHPAFSAARQVVGPTGPVGTFPGHPASLVRQVAELVPRLIFLRQTCPQRKLWTTGEIGKCTRYWLILKDRCFVKYGNSILALWGNALILKRCALEKKETACGKYIHGCPPGLTGSVALVSAFPMAPL